jgi:hypothetical protein
MLRRALVLVAVTGWGLAAFIAYMIVIYLGWFGVMLIGLVTLLAGQFAELDDEAPAASPYLLARRYEQTFEGNPESRMARFAQRVERHKWLYITRTIGIALALLGLNMFIEHQL